jgi:hypothetical protein
MSADNMFPIILIRRMFLRPYLSERDPICGDTKNCKVLQIPSEYNLSQTGNVTQRRTRKQNPSDHLQEISMNLVV